MQGPFNMEVSSTTLLLTQGTTAKQWGQNIFEKAFEFLIPNDPIGESCNIHDVHKCRSYFFYYEKSRNSKRYPFTNVKFEIA